MSMRLGGALVYLQRGKTQEADDQVREILKVDAASPQGLFGLAMVSFYRRQFPQARQQFEQVLEKARQDPLTQMLARISLVNIAIETRDLDEAARQMSLAEKGGESTPDVLALRAYLSLLQGKDLDKAEATLAELVKQHPSSAGYRASLGWLIARRGSVAQALKALKELEPLAHHEVFAHNPGFFDQLGDVYQQAKRPEKAGEAWRKALGLFLPTTGEADRRRKEIEKKLAALKE
jgi:Flp pilus assembly protein TadD